MLATGGSTAIKVVAVIEAASVTGPAKNLIEFCRQAQFPDTGQPEVPVVEATIVTYQRGEMSLNTANPFVAAAREAGIHTDVIHERYRFDARIVRQLSRIVEQQQPDIIQTHNVKSHFLVKLSGLARRYRWIAFHHGYTTTDLKMRAYNALNRWSLPSATRIVTVCRPFARQLSREGVAKQNISVLRNSIAGAPPCTNEEVNDLRDRLRIAKEDRVLLTVGRFSREKGHADLIRAAEQLRHTRPGLAFRLVLVGDGPERRPLERLVTAMGLTDRTAFAGHQNHVGPYFALANALVLPSHTEGSPNVLLEAMAAGVPIVAAAVGGVPEIVAHEETALLVRPRDPVALNAAIDRALSDGELARRLSRNARSQVANHHSPDAYRLALLGIYQETVSNGPRVPGSPA